MKIIKEGVLPVSKHTCKYCGTIIEYDANDVCNIYFDMNKDGEIIRGEVTCPICGNYFIASYNKKILKVTEE